MLFASYAHSSMFGLDHGRGGTVPDAGDLIDRRTPNYRMVQVPLVSAALRPRPGAQGDRWRSRLRTGLREGGVAFLE